MSENIQDNEHIQDIPFQDINGNPGDIEVDLTKHFELSTEEKPIPQTELTDL